VPFLLLGLLLGPGLAVVDAAGLRLLQPVVALAIGWTGALFGTRLEWRMVRRISSRTWLVGATLALSRASRDDRHGGRPGARATTARGSLGRPLLPAALVLGGALTTAASQRGPRLGRRNALLDTAFGAAAVTLAVALYHPQLAPRNIMLTLIAGAALGGLFVALARGGLLAEPRDAGVAACAVILCGAGVSYAAGLSPFVVCAVEGAVLMSFSPADVRHAVAGLLRRWRSRCTRLSL